MITLSKVGNAIKFTFVNNGHYLFNGEIEVPLNSLSLVTDNSEMATFKKSATNDIFISALYSDFGMSKSELETWYKDNMVGSSGGSGSGGTTPEEVQQMIDESISGKADSAAVTEEIAEAVSGKADSDSLATVATSGSYNDLLDKPTIPTVPTDVSAFNNDAGYITSDALSGYATEQWVGQQGYITGVDLSNYATLQDIPDVSNYFDGAEYDSGTTRINFYHGNTVKAYIDASAFIVDGMIDNVSIETIEGVDYLVIDFNTASGKEDIQIPLTDIFDPSNYYNKTEIDNIVSGLNESIDTKLDASAYTPTDLSEYWTSAQTTSAIDAATSGKADTTAVTEAISAATDDMATQTWVGEQGFLTEHQSLSAYSTTEEMNSAIDEATSGKADTSAVTAVNDVLTAHTADTNIHVTTQEKSTWNAKSDFSGSYNDLTDKPTIPTVPTSNTAFTNDAGYITEDALSGYAESSAVTEEITAAVSGKADTSAVTAVNDVLTAHTADTTIHVTAADKTAWNSKSDFSGSYNDLTDKPTIPTVPTSNTAFTNDAGYITSDALSGYAESSAVTEEISAAVSGKVDTTTYTAYTAATDTLIGGKASQSDLETVSGAVANKQDTLVSGTNIKTINNQSLLGSGNIDIQGGGGSGNPTVELTQAEYDALVSAGTVSADTYYIITDATPIDINNYVATSAITSAVTSASTDSEIPTAKAVYDAIPTGGTSGGKAIEAGRGITVTTGETADTVSFNLQFGDLTSGTENSAIFGWTYGTGNTFNSNTTSTYSMNNLFIGIGNKVEGGSWSSSIKNNLLVGMSNTISSTISGSDAGYNFVLGRLNNLTAPILGYSYAFGRQNTGHTSNEFLCGWFNEGFNEYETAFGKYNVSNTGSTTADNTLFSIGNGEWDARHNAFEIRQNGDIYITSGGTDIKLQDNLGGGSVSSAVTSGDTNAVSSDAVYTAMGGLKLQQLTQADYDALVQGGTVDANTLYIITNVVS